MMAESLEELIENRKQLIETHKKNNFTNGIHSLLTDLYPETAHFIYELLQNAEDMDATEIHFKLNQSSLFFEHNGTKRQFNLSDIDAITNIGNNQAKRNDSTAIGKFGVGFKAVFAYTSTPEIHSGKYHFQIHDYFVPVVDGVDKIPTTDEYGVAWTKFIFPFNHKTKTALAAFAETSEGLRELDENSMLFLANIKRISIEIDHQPCILISKTQDKDEPHLYTLSKEQEKSNNQISTQWLCFSNKVQVLDEKRIIKTVNISIAYKLEKNPRNSKFSIVPVQNPKTYIYFPADKEFSHLKFHINAAFASTVARDSIRNCEQNEAIFNHIASLVVDSLETIKSLGLLTISFLSVMPNGNDALTPYYKIIYRAVINAFYEKPYLIDKNGKYHRAGCSVYGYADLSEVFGSRELQKLFGKDYFWIQRPVQRGLEFIRSLKVLEFDYEQFKKLFDRSYDNSIFTSHIVIEEILKDHDIPWFIKFYLLCNKCFQQDDSTFSYNLTHASIILASDNKCHKATELYMPPSYDFDAPKELLVVDRKIFSNTANEKERKELQDFFISALSIRSYGIKDQMLAQIKSYENQTSYIVDRKCCDLLMRIIKYAEEHNKESGNRIDFSAYKLFLYRDDKTLRSARASELVLGPRFGNSVGNEVANLLKKKCLCDDYASMFSKEQLKKFIDFALRCQMSKTLKIIETNARNHPKFYESLVTAGSWSEGYGISIDYSIVNITSILKNITKPISSLIWKTLLAYEKRCLKDYDISISKNTNSRAYQYAVYRANSNQKINKCDSSLVYYLKNYAWLFDKAGNKLKPSEIDVSELDEIYDLDNIESNPLIKALRLGSTLTQKEREIEDAVRLIEKNGSVVMPKSQYDELVRQVEKQQRTKPSVKSIGEGLSKENKKATWNAEDPEDDEQTDIGAVTNKEKRVRNISNTFTSSMNEKPKLKYRYSKVSLSSKEEKAKLQEWYKGKCQICGTRIRSYDGKPYFVAKNIISSDILPDKIRNADYLCWNSLSLCPNCSAKYDVCSKDLSDFEDQVKNISVSERDNSPIRVGFTLNGKYAEITFDPRHFLDLQTIFNNFSSFLDDSDESIIANKESFTIFAEQTVRNVSKTEGNVQSEGTIRDVPKPATPSLRVPKVIKIPEASVKTFNSNSVKKKKKKAKLNNGSKAMVDLPVEYDYISSSKSEKYVRAHDGFSKFKVIGEDETHYFLAGFSTPVLKRFYIEVKEKEKE